MSWFHVVGPDLSKLTNLSKKIDESFNFIPEKEYIAKHFQSTGIIEVNVRCNKKNRYVVRKYGVHDWYAAVGVLGYAFVVVGILGIGYYFVDKALSVGEKETGFGQVSRPNSGKISMMQKPVHTLTFKV